MTVGVPPFFCGRLTSMPSTTRLAHTVWHGNRCPARPWVHEKVLPFQRQKIMANKHGATISAISCISKLSAIIQHAYSRKEGGVGAGETFWWPWSRNSEPTYKTSGTTIWVEQLIVPMTYVTTVTVQGLHKSVISTSLPHAVSLVDTTAVPADTARRKTARSRRPSRWMSQRGKLNG